MLTIGTLKYAAITGKAGRYMSIEIEPIAVRIPSVSVIKKVFCFSSIFPVNIFILPVIPAAKILVSYCKGFWLFLRCIYLAFN